jgi:hypothetical protein
VADHSEPEEYVESGQGGTIDSPIREQPGPPSAYRRCSIMGLCLKAKIYRQGALGRAVGGALLLSMTLCISNTTVLAQQTPPASETAGKENDLFERARDAQRAGNLEEAYRLWREAWMAEELWSSGFEIAANLGQTEAKLKKYRDAAEHLSYALAHLPANATDMKEPLERVLAAVKTQVGTLRVEVADSGVPETIKVQGQVVASWQRSYGEVYVDPGTHTIIASRPGFRRFERQVTVGAGETARVFIGLLISPAPPSPSATPPKETPGATVSIKKTSSGNAALERTSTILFIGGGITLAALGSGWAFQAAADRAERYAQGIDDLFAAKYPMPYPCQSESLEIQADCRAVTDALVSKGPYSTAAAMSFTAAGIAALGTGAAFLLVPSATETTPKLTRSAIPALIGSGLSVAGIGAGLGFLVAASSSADRAETIASDFDRPNSCGSGSPHVSRCSDIVRMRNQQYANRDLALVSFTVAAAEAAGVATYLLWPTQGDGSPAQQVVVLGAGLIGVQGAF